MREITSLNNELIKEYVKLQDSKYRKEKKMFIIEGINMTNEASRIGILDTIFISDRNTLTDIKFDSEHDVYLVPQKVLEKLSSTKSAPNVISIGHFLKPQTINYEDNIVIFDNIQDPSNFGAIARSALAFGFRNIITYGSFVDVYNTKVLRSSQGSVFQLNIENKNNFDDILKLKKKGYTILNSSISIGAVNVNECNLKGKKVAIIFGNEGRGVSEEMNAVADKNIFIPIKGIDSLNVSVAAGIILNKFSDN